MSKTSTGNMFYDKSYYNKCIKVYIKSYPIKEIDLRLYFSYLNSIKIIHRLNMTTNN